MLDSPKASMEEVDEFRLGGRCDMAFAYQNSMVMVLWMIVILKRALWLYSLDCD